MKKLLALLLALSLSVGTTFAVGCNSDPQGGSDTGSQSSTSDSLSDTSEDSGNGSDSSSSDGDNGGDSDSSSSDGDNGGDSDSSSSDGNNGGDSDSSSSDGDNGDNDAENSVVKFWVYGDEHQLATYAALVNAFNEGYGKRNNITVDMSAKPASSYLTLMKQTAQVKWGADVGVFFETYIKSLADMDCIGELDEYVAKYQTAFLDAEFYPSIIDRFYYNTETGSSTVNDSLYGIPFNVNPSALYYNETYFEEAGIKVISVDEEDLAAWNLGGVEDKRGNTKESLGLSGVTVPAKGYYRSKNPYVFSPEGESWEAPASDEVLVFNNRIPMNWDEQEDLAMLFTHEYRTSSPTDYGYYSENWCNYVWSVGGDSLTDLNGNSEWNFSLLDNDLNYIVKEGKTYVGLYSAKTYQAGESLAFYDRMAISSTDVVVPQEDGSYTVNGQKVQVRSEVVAEAEKTDGSLQALPSSRDALMRYVRMTYGPHDVVTFSDGMMSEGLGISPTSTLFLGSGRLAHQYFGSGHLAMYAGTFDEMLEIDERLDGRCTFNVAPLPEYKTYVDPTDPQCAQVASQGKSGGHSESEVLTVRKNSERKDEAVQFLLWMASEEAQKIRTGRGYFPVSEKYADDISASAYNNMPQNVRLFAEAIEKQGAQQWMYLPDYTWSDCWFIPFVVQILNGHPNMTIAQWIQQAIRDTNEELARF